MKRKTKAMTQDEILALIGRAFSRDALAAALNIQFPDPENMVSAAMKRGAERLHPQSYATVRDGIALIPISGPLSTSGAGMSYETIFRDIQIALNEQSVRGIFLDIGSPGGAGAQFDECATSIRAASKRKPVWAHISTIGASAAYALAVAARTVTASPTAVVGSVGAKIEYLDMSKMLEKYGAAKVKAVSTQSPNKSLEPGSPEWLAEVQPIVDELASIFIGSIARHRGVTRDIVLEKFGQGSVFTAADALRRGMIDGVMPFEAAFMRASEQASAPAGATSTRAIFAQSAETGSESEEVTTEEASASLAVAADSAGAEIAHTEQIEAETAVTAAQEFEGVNDMSKDTIKILTERRQHLLGARNRIVDEASKRPDKLMTEAEAKEVAGIDVQIATIDKNRQLQRRGIELEEIDGEPLARMTEATAADPLGGVEPLFGSSGSKNKFEEAQCAGYTPGINGIGEMALDLIEFRSTGRRSSRLGTLTALGHEGEKGGYFLPAALAKPLKEALIGQMSLLEFCDTDEDIDAYSFEIPVDDAQDWDTTRGLQAQAAPEGGTAEYSDISLDRRLMQLGKVQVKIKVTDELMKTVSTLARFLVKSASRKMQFKVSNFIARGTGVNQPLGFLNSPALVTVAAEGSQSADTLVAENVAKMIAANSSSESAFERLLFLMHPQLVDQAELLTVKATSQVYGATTGNRAARPERSLFGVPYRTHQICNRPGDIGDIMLLDLKEYYAPVFRGGIEMRVSEDAGFDDDTTRMKFTMHLGGVPYLNAPIASRDGTFVQSPFVVLGAR